MLVPPTTFWIGTFSVQNGLLTATQNGQALSAITVHSFDQFRHCLDAVLDPLFPPPENRGARKTVRQISEAALALEHLIRGGHLDSEAKMRRQLNIIGAGLMKFKKMDYQRAVLDLNGRARPEPKKNPTPKPEEAPKPVEPKKPSLPRLSITSPRVANLFRYLTVTELYKEIGSNGKLLAQLQRHHALDDFSKPSPFAAGLAKTAIEFSETDPELSTAALSTLIRAAILTLKIPFYMELENTILNQHPHLFKVIHVAEFIALRSRLTMIASISRYERFEILLRRQRPDLFPNSPPPVQPPLLSPRPTPAVSSQIRQWVEEIRTEFPTLHAYLKKGGAFEHMNPPNRFAEVLKEAAVAIFGKDQSFSYDAVACTITGALILHRYPFRAALDTLIQNHPEIFQPGHKKVLETAEKTIKTRHERTIWTGFTERLKAKRPDLF